MPNHPPPEATEPHGLPPDATLDDNFQQDSPDDVDILALAPTPYPGSARSSRPPSRSSSTSSSAFEPPGPHSCVHCSAFVLRQEMSSEIVLRNFHVRLHSNISFADILVAAGQGCVFAELFVGDGDYFAPEDGDPREWILCGRFVTSQPEMIGPFGLWNPATRDVMMFSLRQFTICTPADDPAADTILTRPMAHDFVEETYHFVRDALDECVDSHAECQVRTDMIPTRLIEIIDSAEQPDSASYAGSEQGSGSYSTVPDRRWKLRICCNPIAHFPRTYCALSYCWGPSNPSALKTTRATLPLWSQDLPWDIVPRTIQDAIGVTCVLGMRFLWVDALCIVQDDLVDVTHEISLMPLIYGQAEVTIVAARAKAVDEGFIYDNVTLWHDVESFQLPFAADPSASLRPSDDDPISSTPASIATTSLGSICLFPSYGHLTTEPLDLRGWAMQERLLSRRVLEFASRQTRVSCRADPEGQSDGWTALAEKVPGRLDHLPSTVGNPSGDHTSYDHGLAREERWMRQVHIDSMVIKWHELAFHYTRRSLTFETDRLLAISGLAARFSSVLPREYLAGLWECRLAHELLWELDVDDEDRGPRPAMYLAPSWSWATLNRPIRYRLPNRLESTVEITDASVSLVSRVAPFGAVTAGHITVRGRLRPAQWTPGDTSGKPPYHRERLRHFIPSPLPSPLRSYSPSSSIASPSASGPPLLPFRVVSDATCFDVSPNEWATVFLLQVATTSPATPTAYHGLVLRSHENAEGSDLGGQYTYSRLGLFSFTPEYCHKFDHEHGPANETEGRTTSWWQYNRWFESCTETTLTII